MLRNKLEAVQQQLIEEKKKKCGMISDVLPLDTNCCRRKAQLERHGLAKKLKTLGKRKSSAAASKTQTVKVTIPL